MPDLLYLEPGQDYPLSQGDIFTNVPFVSVRERPLLIARHIGHWKGLITYSVHKEFDGPTTASATALPPEPPIHLKNPQQQELALVPVLLTMGIVLTHDCEIDNDDHRTAAMIRPITDLKPPYQEKCLAGERMDMFPLLAQDEAPSMVTSFVDFRKVTPLRPGALEAPAVRYATVAAELREALASAYWDYLHHPHQEERPPLNA